MQGPADLEAAGDQLVPETPSPAQTTGGLPAADSPSPPDGRARCRISREGMRQASGTQAYRRSYADG
jgi:hypothetical protein